MSKILGSALRWLLVALSLTIFAAPAAALAAPGVVVIGSEARIPPLDPHRMSGTVGLRIIDALFDPLVREDLSQVTDTAPPLKPALAASWTISPDGLTYTFKLRKGVVFHDGTSFDSAAIQANFARLMDKNAPTYDARAAGNMVFLTRWIASTSAPDADTFAITLKEPFPGLLRLLSDRRMSIVSPAALEKFNGDKLGLNPVGTGPFTLKTFQQGEPVSLSRFDGFWGTKPSIERLIFQPITDRTAMAIAMQTGQVDIIPSASSQQIAQLKDDPAVTVQFPEPANEYYVRFNTKAEVTNNVKFRQALNYAVNRDGIAALFDGEVIPAYGPLPIGNEIPPTSLKTIYSYDVEKAKQLLADSGLETPISIKLLAPNSGPGFGLAAEVVALLQQDLKAVGVDLQVQFLEFSTLIATEGPGYKDDVQGSYNGWTTGADSPYFLERMFSGSQQPPSGVNRGWYDNAAVDQLFADARKQVDETRRNELYLKAAELISADAPWLFLYQNRLPRVVAKRVTGVSPARSVFLDYTSLAAQ